MIENFVILSETEIAKFQDKPWFDKEVFKLTNACGYVNYLVPKNRYEDKSVLIEELIAEFDWQKVERIMKELQWTWWGYNRQPTIKEMQKFVRSLYSSIKDMVENNKYAFSASGGFKLTFNPDEDNELSLVFEAVTASVYKLQ